MRAKFINEKFIEDSDPVKDMNIGLTRRFNEIKKLLEDMNKDMSIDIAFDEIEENRDEFTIKTDTTSFLHIDDYRPRGPSWEDVGVYSSFEFNYYLDILLPENKIIRAIYLKNPDIKDFNYWNKKIICDNILKINNNDIAKLINNDYLNIENTKEFDDGLDEAWDLAEVDYEKTQKRIRS